MSLHRPGSTGLICYRKETPYLNQLCFKLLFGSLHVHNLFSMVTKNWAIIGLHLIIYLDYSCRDAVVRRNLCTPKSLEEMKFSSPLLNDAFPTLNIDAACNVQQRGMCNLLHRLGLLPSSVHPCILHPSYVQGVTIQVVPNLPLTWQHKLCFRTWASY